MLLLKTLNMYEINFESTDNTGAPLKGSNPSVTSARKPRCSHSAPRGRCKGYVVLNGPTFLQGKKNYCMFMFIHPLSRIIIVHLLLHYIMLSTEIILKTRHEFILLLRNLKETWQITMIVRGISRKCWAKFHYEGGLQMCIVYRICCRHTRRQGPLSSLTYVCICIYRCKSL